MSQKFYALLIGINSYSHPVGGLDEAVGNAQDMCRFIKNGVKHLSAPYIKLLTDKAASRENIISQLEYIASKVAPDDICLIYFAGHGSTEPVPSALHKKEANESMETLICIDSRVSVLDLADKEMSCLIYEINKRNDVHVTVIMDCCHAGDNTKKDEYGTKTRSAAPNIKPRQLHQFYRFDRYSSYPPKAKHIVMAACRDDQEAFDGFFTDELLKALKQDACASYKSLNDTVCKGLAAFSQAPQLSPRDYVSLMENQAFLDGIISI